MFGALIVNLPLAGGMSQPKNNNF